MANETMIGFKAKCKVDSTYFAKTVMLQIPSREFGEAEFTSLDQANKERVFKSTLRDNGTAVMELFFTAENMTAVLALHGVNDKSFVFESPDPDGSEAALGKSFTCVGFLKKIGEVKFEKDQPAKFNVEIRVSSVTVANLSNET
jgi:hypothetical protein